MAGGSMSLTRAGSVGASPASNQYSRMGGSASFGGGPGRAVLDDPVADHHVGASRGAVGAGDERAQGQGASERVGPDARGVGERDAPGPLDAGPGRQYPLGRDPPA